MTGQDNLGVSGGFSMGSMGSGGFSGGGASGGGGFSGGGGGGASSWAGVIEEALGIVGNGLNLAAVKRQGESMLAGIWLSGQYNLEALEEQGKIAELNAFASSENLKQMGQIALVLGVVAVAGIIAWKTFGK